MLFLQFSVYNLISDAVLTVFCVQVNKMLFLQVSVYKLMSDAIPTVLWEKNPSGTELLVITALLHWFRVYLCI